MSGRTQGPTLRSWVGLRAPNARGYLFVAPALVGLLILSAGPIFASLAISLTDWDLLTAPTFVGFDNFARLLADRRFASALRNTVFYVVVSVPVGMTIALGLAVALNRAIAGISVIRTLYFLPLVTSAIAVGLVWAWIYSPANGLLNQVLALFGLPPQKWISDPFWAMPAIVAMSVWQGLAASTIIFLAGMQAIPDSLYDAAHVDGAGAWQRFRYISLPLLTPSLFFTGILNLIGSFQVFDQVFVLARPGQPTTATITLVYFIYENGFRNFKMGYASAASWVLFLIVSTLTVLYFRSQGRWVHYG
jgi:multiple sugar transport system permease protein